ncbi:MAG: DUF177 domain-containing protein [Anaerolineales bacterium]|nr:DUF177 domain-containing protein [Anaerolineales bacterium]
MSQKSRTQLIFNVGFLLHQSRGFSRRYDFNFPSVQLADDLTLLHLDGNLTLTRSGDGLLAQGSFSSEVNLECTRCLETFLQPLEIEFSELLVFPAKEAEDPVLAIPESGQLDLNPLLRENFLLMIPLQPHCSEDCKGLCPICGNNLNENACYHDSEDIDPRLEVLKNLLD